MSRYRNLPTKTKKIYISIIVPESKLDEELLRLEKNGYKPLLRFTYSFRYINQAFRKETLDFAKKMVDKLTKSGKKKGVLLGWQRTLKHEEKDYARYIKNRNIYKMEMKKWRERTGFSTVAEWKKSQKKENENE